MNESNPKPRKPIARWLTVAGCTIAILVVAVLALPIFGRTAARGTNTVSVSNGKQLYLAIGMYASDHDDRLPITLYELFPGYLPGFLTDYGVLDPNPKSKGRYEWLYFPSPIPATGTRILLAAPFSVTFRSTGTLRRLVIYSDGTFDNLPEPDFRVRILRESRDRIPTPATPYLCAAGLRSLGVATHS